MHEVHLRCKDLRPFSWTCAEETLGRRVHEAWLEGQPCQGVHTHVALSATQAKPSSFIPAIRDFPCTVTIHLDLKQVQACMAAGQ